MRQDERLADGGEPIDAAEQSFEETADGTAGSPNSSSTFGRVGIAIFCFGLSVLLMVLPVTTSGTDVIMALVAAPGIGLVFIGWYVGRPVLAAYQQLKHTKRERHPWDDAVLPSITVMMPAYNEEKIIGEAVRGVFEQAEEYPVPVEVVVCDDGSTDKTWSFLRFMAEVYDGLTVVTQENGGIAAARNTALKEASNEIIMSMDADTVLADDALYETGMAYLRNPEAMAVGTNVGVLNPDESIWTRMQVVNYLLSMELGRMFQSAMGFVLVLSGGCSTYRREVVEKVGGWNDTRLLSEDYDMTIRVHEHGKVLYSPSIHAYTEVPATFRSLWKQRYLWRQGGTAVTLAHLGKQGNRAYGSLGLIGLPIRLALLSLIGLTMVKAVLSVAGGQIPVETLLQNALVAGVVLSTGLSAFMVGFTVLFCRDRKALEIPTAAIWYLLVYRWFHLTVRFIGTLRGVYNYLLYKCGIETWRDGIDTARQRFTTYR